MPGRGRPRRERRSGRRPRTPGRGRIVLIVIAVVLFFLIMSMRSIALFYTDYLWFKSLRLTQVWRTVLTAKAALTFIFVAFFFGLAWANLTIADRVAPRFLPSGPQEELVARYRELIGSHAKSVRAGISLLAALIVGSGVSSRWNDWVLFTNAVKFGQKDATFRTDIGFYVFRLPFLTFVASWLFTAFLITLIITVAAHYFNGGIRSQGAIQRVTPQVKAHISVLLGVLALVKAGQYWLARYQLVFSTRGTVDGATYTDVHVQKNVIYLLIIISFFAFALFVVNIWRRGWVLPALAVGLWAFVAILAGGVVPAFVQQVRVKPAESTKEAPYISHNIAATRAALKLDRIKTRTFNADGKIDITALNDNASTVSNVRLWDPAENILMQNYRLTQELRSFYAINDVDVDRYPLDAATDRQVMVSARELDSAGVTQKSWEAQHLLFTHGYGVVMAPANATTADGSPRLVESGIPVQTSGGAPAIKQPRIYIGENQTSYVMVKTRKNEVDGLGNDTSAKASPPYRGKDGITMGAGLTGFLRRAAFSLRFNDINPLISGSVTKNSKILVQRSVTARLKAVAPFLSFDHDPYLVVDQGGRLQWIVDAYTTTNRYPNAQRAVTDGLVASSGLARKDFNYVRNSVKAVVDAYDGTVKLYVIDDQDPLIRAYRKAFPKLFTAGSDMPRELRAHLRYPEDLFTVQTTMWGRYHINRPQDFYQKQDAWAIPTQPGANPTATEDTSGANATGAGGATPTTAANGARTGNGATAMAAYYQLMRLPREDRENFLIFLPFVPANSATKPLRSFIVAKSDPGSYGQLEAYVVPAGTSPTGPELAAQNIQSDPQVSQFQTLAGQQGSKVIYGNLLLIPINQSLLYVRPVYVKGSGDQSVPLLKKVVIGYPDSKGAFQVKIADTFEGALAAAFGNSPNTQEETTNPTPAPTPIPGTGGPGVSSQEDTLINQINSALAAADAALASRNLAEYQHQVQIATDAARQLQQLRAGGGGGAAPSPSTTAPGGAGGAAGPTTTAPSAVTPTTGV